MKSVSGKILWANLFLFFWLSLFPFVTAWAGENNFAPIPVALYGFDLLMAAVAYWILTNVIIHTHGGERSLLSKAIGSDFKGKISIVLNAAAIVLACWQPVLSCLIYFIIALWWLVPDKRIEKVIHS